VTAARHGRARALRLGALALATLLLPAVAWAQASLLAAELLEKLVPATERPLALAPDGEPLRFRTGPERWEEAMPPAIVDLDRNGTKDYIVLILADGDSGRRALLARAWGDALNEFGPTVFYVILDDNDDVSEWAGSPRLDLPAPKP
jgi:hypothetical protein